MNTIKELNDALDNIAAAMTDKGITSPKPDITHTHGGRVSGWLIAESLIGGEECVRFTGGSAEIVFSNMMAHVTALPSAEEKAAQDFAIQIARVIDFGRDNGIDDEYIAPLRTARATLTGNLLTHSA